MAESWKAIDGWPYEVSDIGRVRRTRRASRKYPAGYLLKPRPSKRLNSNAKPYMFVELQNNGRKLARYIHTLVADAFIGPRPAGMEVNHKNGDKTHCRADNLEYVTRAENLEHAKAIGLNQNFGGTHWNARLALSDARDIKMRCCRKESQSSIAQDYGVSRSLVRDIATGRRWSRALKQEAA